MSGMAVLPAIPAGTVLLRLVVPVRRSGRRVVVASVDSVLPARPVRRVVRVLHVGRSSFGLRLLDIATPMSGRHPRVST